MGLAYLCIGACKRRQLLRVRTYKKASQLLRPRKKFEGRVTNQSCSATVLSEYPRGKTVHVVADYKDRWG